MCGLLDLFSGELEFTPVAVGHRAVVGMGLMYPRATGVHHLAGTYALPGFIDGHVPGSSGLVDEKRR